MLQAILDSMFIEPEILAELPDEQKQLLFCKLREEQLRRWRLREAELEQNGSDKKSSAPKKQQQRQGKKGGKKVDFLIAADGQPWVWVMGDHPDDKSVEQILEEEAAAKATRKAEEEAELLRQREEAEQHRKEKEEEERLRREQLDKEAQLQKEAEARRLAEDQLQSLKAKQLEENEQKLKMLQEKREQFKLVREQSYKDLKAKRTSEILADYISQKGTQDKSAPSEEAQQLDRNWQLQEAKVKVMEEKMRTLARFARQEHRTNSIRVQLTRKDSQAWREVSPSVNSVNLTSFTNIDGPVRLDPPPQPSVQPRAPPRSNGRAAAEKWFIEREKEKGVGVDSTSGTVWDWFHGSISRASSEAILENKRVHSFLVRLSDKIWGYVISYKAEDSFKHFLVDVTADGVYQFFGTDQLEHETLTTLVQWHKTSPITISGQELLLYPCGQICSPADYVNILPEHVETTLL